MLFDNLHTDITFNLAAPMELAIATFSHHNIFGIVTPAAAENATAIQTIGGFVALTAMGTLKYK